MKYTYYHICLDCGKKYATSDHYKGSIGMWGAVCPVCKTYKYCAAAGHDFGVYEIPKSVKLATEDEMDTILLAYQNDAKNVEEISIEEESDTDGVRGSDSSSRVDESKKLTFCPCCKRRADTDSVQDEIEKSRFEFRFPGLRGLR